MKQSQLKLLSELLADSNKSVKMNLRSDALILKVHRNEIYIAFAITGLLFSALLLFFRKNSEINLELGMFAFIFSITALVKKQAPNKTLIFNSNTNTLAIIPSFFLNKWSLKFLIKINKPISFKEISEIRITYGFFNNESRWTLGFKERFWFISLLSFTNEKNAKEICNLLNEMRR